MPEEQQDQTVETSTLKRKRDDSSLSSASPPSMEQGEEEKQQSKKQKFGPKKRVAVILGYNGAKYCGLQINEKHAQPSIDGELFDAIVKAGGVSEDNSKSLKKVVWQRSSRTDKGVHAAMNVISLKMIISVAQDKSPEVSAHDQNDNVIAKGLTEEGTISLTNQRDISAKASGADSKIANNYLHIEDQKMMERINHFLPQDIRVLGMCRVTRSFHAKNFCDGRRYEYIIPTFAFDDPKITLEQIEVNQVELNTFSKSNQVPIEKIMKNFDTNYRISEQKLEKLKRVLEKYKGSHYFHNFTKSSKYKSQQSTMRFIVDFKSSQPLMINGMECVKLIVEGQSFMIYQIRKMIGLVLAIMRGYLNEDYISDALNPKEHMIIATAPGEGLILDECFFKSYNNRHEKGRLPLSKSLVQEKSEQFKQGLYEFIVGQEQAEHNLARWLYLLPQWLVFREKQGNIPGAMEADFDEDDAGDDES